VCLALVVDKDGQKMSKSKGNVIDPWTILDTRGADALRWNFFSSGSPWTARRVYPESIDESTRRFLLTFWNTYSFFVTYANADGWEPTEGAGAPVSDDILDRWVRSRLAATVNEVTDALDGFDALRGAQALDRFVDDLSNWYVQRSRPRFWNADDASAHATLYEALVTLTLLLAPYTPFVADEVHRNLSGRADSVHLADWPVADLGARDERLEAEMADARVIVSLGRAARNDARLKVRQPLRRALVLLPEGAALSGPVTTLVAEALNVKQVETVSDLEGLLDYVAVPNFRTLGPKAGARVPLVKDALADADAGALRRTLDEAGEAELQLSDGTTFVLAADDVEIRASSHEELVLAQDGAYAVALDTTLDDALRDEGRARDLIRLLNEARKDAGLDVSDRIRVQLWGTGAVVHAAAAHADWIAAEVLALDFTVAPTLESAPTEGLRITIDDEELVVVVEKVENQEG
jgi:isoleucyl-tRNA synthetase